MPKIGDHAVVLGAGMAGLLAARVLADAYGRVTVVERDLLPETDENRRGVPQGRHAHLLVTRGTQILDELFPGLLDDLVAQGAPVVRDFAEFRFSPGGHLLRLEGRPAQPFSCQASRPYLEGHVRARVRALPTVGIVDRCEMVGLVTNAARDRVTGVRVVHRAAGGAEDTIDADLVLDATGRGGRMPVWLATIGYDPPPEEQLTIHLRYATRHLRLRAGALGAEKVVAIGAEPGRPTGFVLLAQEGDRWILTVIGYDGHHPPTDPEDFLAFVETIAPPDVLAAIRDAEPLDGIVAHRFPANVRRRYEKLRRFPAGLLVFGDAICSTNPAYALGMSVAALQAAALRDSLAGGDHHLARRFFKAAARPIGMAWQLTIGADLALPEVKGPRPLPVRVVNAYVRRVQSAGARDPMVAEQFLRAADLQDPASRLFRPSTALRVLLGDLRPRPVATIDAVTACTPVETSTSVRPPSMKGPAMPDFPAFTHVAVTVTDLERSTRWYSELFAAAPVLDEDEPTGGFHHTVFALDRGQLFGLHTHPQTAGDRFDEHRTGLDHIAFACRDRDELQKRAARLDELGIAHGEIKDAHYGSGVSFRDPDGIALEFFAPPA